MAVAERTQGTGGGLGRMPELFPESTAYRFPIRPDAPGVIRLSLHAVIYSRRTVSRPTTGEPGIALEKEHRSGSVKYTNRQRYCQLENFPPQAGPASSPYPLEWRNTHESANRTRDDIITHNPYLCRHLSAPLQPWRRIDAPRYSCKIITFHGGMYDWPSEPDGTPLPFCLTLFMTFLGVKPPRSSNLRPTNSGQPWKAEEQAAAAEKYSK